MKWKVALSFTALAFFFAVLTVMAAQKLSLDVNLTMLRSHVVDQTGGAVLDLRADDFEVLENGIPMPISHFSMDSGPTEIGLLVDSSLSLRPLKDDLKQTVGQLVTSMNGDRAFLMTFASDTDLIVPATYDLAEITKGIGKLRTGAGTRFYDATLRALDELVKSRRERKALIILTDGADYYSSHSFEQLLKSVKLYGCEIYILGYTGDDSRTWTERGRAEIRSQFFQLASVTGGQIFFPGNLAESARIARRVMDSLHHEYRFGYYSSHPFSEPSEVAVRIRGERGTHLYVSSALVPSTLP
jgi:VWFA-related protein